MHMLASYGAPNHVDWVLAEATTEGLVALLSTLFWEIHPLVTNLLYLVRHNAR